MKILRYFLYFILAALVMVAITFAWLSGTNSGMNTILSQVPGLQVQSTQGRLWDKTLLQGIEYQQGAMRVVVAQAALTWHPMSLIGSQLHIAELSTREIDVFLPPPSDSARREKPGKTEMPDINLPLDIQIDSINVNAVKIHQGDSVHVINDIDLQVATQRSENRVDIGKLRVNTPEIGLELAGTLGLHKPHPVDLKLQAKLDKAPVGKALANIALSGDTRVMKVTIKGGLLPADTLPQMDISATILDVLGDIGWQAKIDVQQIDTTQERLQQLAAGVPPLQASLHLNSAGNLNKAEASANIALNSPEFGAFDINLKAGGENPRWQIHHLRITQAGESPVTPAADTNGVLSFLDNVSLSELVEDASSEPAAAQQNSAKPLSLTLTGDVDISDASKPVFNAEINWQALRWPLQGEEILAASPTGILKLSGTPASYQLSLDTRAEGGQVPPSRWQLAGKGTLEQFNLTQLHGELLNGELNASAQVAWKPELKVSAKLDGAGIQPKQYVADWPDNVAVDLNLVAELIDQAFTVSALKIDLPGYGGSLNISAKGKTDASDLYAEVGWTTLAWPLSGPPQASSPVGALTIKGSKDAYTLALQTKVAGKDVPKGTWRLDGNGSDKFFNIKELRGETLDGALTARGQVHWNVSEQVPVQWNLVLNGDKLNPGVQWQDLPGHVSWHLNSKGKLIDGKPVATLKIPDLKGKLKGYPLTLQADLEADATGYHIRQFDFQSAGAKLSATGLAGDVLNLSWDLDVPALDKLVPKAKGVFSSSGKVTGAAQQPSVKAKVDVKDVIFQDLRIAKVKANANLDLQADAPLDIAIDVNGVKQAGQRIDKVTVRADGRTSKHTLTLALDAPQAKLDMALQGGLDMQKQSWQGLLQTVRVDGGEFGAWTLKNAAMLALSAKQAQVGESCFVSRKTVLCAEADWNAAGKTLATLKLDNFGLDRIAPFMPDNLDISGTLGAAIQAELASAGTPQVDAKITLTPGTIKTALADETPLSIPHQGARIKAKVDNNGGRADLNFTFQQRDYVKGHVSLPGLRLPLAENQGLAGQVSVNISDFNILSALVPDISKAQGSLTAHVDLGGHLNNPVIQGDVKLADGAMEIDVAGLELRELALNIQANASSRVEINGGVKSGKEGFMKLAGAFQPNAKGNWQGDLSIDGKKFEALNTPDGWVFIEPALRINLKPQHLYIGGELTIPRAELTPQGGGGGSGDVVTVSDDVVIVQDEVEKKEETIPDDGFKVSSNVRVNLGDKVRVEAAGFKGYVSGHLRAISEANQTPRGSGEIEVTGTYKSYGQDLTVEKGTLAFNNSPLDNPILNMRATRYHDGDEVTTGVKVRGTAQEPTLELFSEPAMDQSNALAYLVLGGPLGTGSEEGDSDTLMKAAAAMPLGKSGFITRQIAREFGLDEARISSEGNLEVGKYLTPRLYLKYASSLFDSGQVLKLRYRLTKHLHLETQAGSETGADLLYSLER